MKIILLGPPGAGKGTQAEKIINRYNIVHISTGDIFRDNLKSNTPLGMKAREYMDKGLLVPDDLTVEMVKDRISKDDCKNGYLLDGFPRTLAQADALELMGEKLDCALAITADYDDLVGRITGRRICRDCGAVYHVVNIPSKVEGVCDNCGGELYQRNDDNAETVSQRLDEYNEKTLPLIVYYTKKGILKQVNGSKPIEETTSDVFAILDEFR